MKKLKDSDSVYSFAMRFKYLNKFYKMKLSVSIALDMVPQCYFRQDKSRRINFLHIAMIIGRGGRVIAAATNREGNRSCGCGHSDYSIHAERAVLKKVGDLTKLRGATMVVVRLLGIKTTNYSPRLGSSEPCYECQTALKKCIREYGLRAVYYS